MLDIRKIVENPEGVEQALKNKGVDAPIRQLVEWEKKRKEITSLNDQKKAQRNQASQSISVLKKEGKDASVAIEDTRVLGEEIKELEVQQKEIETQINDLLLTIPNTPNPQVPVGKSHHDNIERRRWGTKPTFSFPLKDHLEIGERLGLFDFKRGAKITGRGFPVYTGMGAKLERALIQFFLDEHQSNGFTELLPPLLVNRASMIGTGQLPKMEEDMYHITADDLFLIPTAEVPVTNYHADEVLSSSQLPLLYAAYSACFRREAGSWGKDTRGFQRLHQFNKVEMVAFADPEKSYDVLEFLVQQAEKILQKLQIHYRVLELCSGDMSFSAAKCYDLEVYGPFHDTWLEVSSVSNFEDYQARRANIRFKADGKPKFCHTLNGSGLATPRLLVSMLESNQTEEGDLIIPPALRPYLGGLEKISAPQ